MPRKKKDETPPPEAAAPEVTPPAVPGSSIVEVALGRLIRAPENVRQTHDQAQLEELAADIAGHGLLQSLIGYDRHEDGTMTIISKLDGELAQVDTDIVLDAGGEPLVFIVGGGRRLAALKLLRELGSVDESYPVPVLIRPKEEAIELSLAENLARQDMNPVDQFRGFKRLMERGDVSPADLARRFGYSVDLVRQRMRLADIAPEILDALSEGRITIDAAMAYASTQDTSVQLRVFKGQEKSNWQPHSPDAIRREIRGATFEEDDRLVRYVGLDAYTAAGGAFDDDLFAAFDVPESSGEKNVKRRLVDTTLVRSLARDKAMAALPALAAEHDYSELLLSLESDSYGSVKAPKPPKGFVKVETNWNFQAAEMEKMLAAARGKDVPIAGVATVDNEGRLSIVTRTVYLPKAAAEELKSKPRESGYRAPTPEEREAEYRQRHIDIWAPRLAVPRFTGTPYEGRAFWPQNQHWPHDLKEDADLGRGYFVDVRVFVPAEDRDAQVEEAGRRYDEAKAARERQEQAAEAERQQAAEAQAVLRERLLAEPPAVIRLDEEPFDFFRHEDGSWPDVRPGEEMNAEYGFESLEQLLDHADAIESPVLHWPTLEAFDIADIGTTPGMCRVCECTESHACEGGCSWADETRTLCSNPDCTAVAAKARTRRLRTLQPKQRRRDECDRRCSGA